MPAVKILSLVIGFLALSVIAKGAQRFTGSWADARLREVAMHDEVDLGEKRITDWSPNGQRLLGYKKDAQGVWQIYTWDTTGGDEQWITVPEGIAELSANCHKGFPHYDPTGRYIAVTVEMNFLCPKKFSQPGLAASTNLWIVDSQTNTWTNLTKYRFPETTTDLHGALSPYISPDGKKIMWANILEAADYTQPHQIFGKWELHVADLTLTPRPQISNDTVYNFEGGNLYEPHGFSPDSTRIMFSSDIGLQYSGALDIWQYDLQTQELQNLTNTTHDYEEHSRYLPGGTQIVYGSTACCKWYDPSRFLATLASESYLMDIPSTQSERVSRPVEQLTKHNSLLQYGQRSGNWPTAVSPDGKQLVVWQQFYDGTPDKSWLVPLGAQ